MDGGACASKRGCGVWEVLRRAGGSLEAVRLPVGEGNRGGGGLDSSGKAGGGRWWVGVILQLQKSSGGYLKIKISR